MTSKRPPDNVKRFIVTIDGVPMSQALTVVSPQVFAAETDRLMRKDYRHIQWLELYFPDAVLLIKGDMPITHDDELTCRQMVEDYLQALKRKQTREYMSRRRNNEI